MQLPNLSARSEDANGFLRPAGHETVMRRFINDVVNDGNFSILDDLVHPDYVYRAPGQELHGPEELKALFAAYRTAFPDLHIDIEDLLIAGDKAVIAFTLTGTHAGVLMGIGATGKEVEAHGMVLSRFKDGKIIEEWEILDQLTLFEQLGVVSLHA
jgi:steroid delta-isomerase-like uncharacterized protein